MFRPKFFRYEQTQGFFEKLEKLLRYSIFILNLGFRMASLPIANEDALYTVVKKLFSSPRASRNLSQFSIMFQSIYDHLVLLKNLD